MDRSYLDPSRTKNLTLQELKAAARLLKKLRNLEEVSLPAVKVLDFVRAQIGARS